MRNGSYLVGVKVEFLPLAVRFLFVGGTKTIPPDVMIASIIMIAVCDDLEQLLTDASKTKSIPPAEDCGGKVEAILCPTISL